MQQACVFIGVWEEVARQDGKYHDLHCSKLQQRSVTLIMRRRPHGFNKSISESPYWEAAYAAGA